MDKRQAGQPPKGRGRNKFPPVSKPKTSGRLLDQIEFPWISQQGVTGKRRALGCPLQKPQIKVLSYNIQAGFKSSSYYDCVRNVCKQFFYPSQLSHLDLIGDLLFDYDIVVLQEADGGSLRSGYVNQIEYLARVADFKYWHQQLNRDIGRFGQFSNGLLSRIVPFEVENHSLPGLKGRGAILARFGRPEYPLTVLGLHLALGEKTRHRQIDYVTDLVAEEKHVVLMGDLNCCEKSVLETALADSGLQHANFGMDTYPSWAPSRCIDHIWVTPGLTVDSVRVIPTGLSDHCPLATQITLPPGMIGCQKQGRPGPGRPC